MSSINTFAKYYNDLKMPVIIVTASKDNKIVYMNTAATIILAPTMSVDYMLGRSTSLLLTDVFSFTSEYEKNSLLASLNDGESVNHFEVRIKTHDKKLLPYLISANKVESVDGDDHFIIYLTATATNDVESELFEHNRKVSTIIKASYQATNADEAIQKTIAVAGEIVNVSRTYIFEEINEETTANTYEWCASGIEPAIQDLQELKKEDYNYDVIVNSGMYITNDVRDLPEGDREILEMQGIKSLAIITLYDRSKPIGYVGFDDCNDYHAWSQFEIALLNSVAELLVTLIKRRSAEKIAASGQEILKTITTNTDELIYVNTLDDYELVFISDALLKAIGKKEVDVLGKKCYEVIQNKKSPCDFCPISKISWDGKQAKSDTYSWEMTNGINKNHYLAKDNILKWVTDEFVHIETAVDITDRVKHEDELKILATTDVLTKIPNRAGGLAWFEEELTRNIGGSLCFIDVDGLKHINDKYSHTAGDELLVSTVEFLKKNLKENEYICRWGGDEFLLWLDEPEEKARTRMAKLEAEAQKTLYNKKRNYLSFSFGVAEFSNKKMSNLDAIITEADNAMYQNKAGKRGQKGSLQTEKNS